MKALKGLLAIAAGVALSLSAVACGDDDSSTGGKLSGGGAGGTGGTGGVVVPPSCTSSDLGNPTCVSCVGLAMTSCPNVALQCFSGGELFTCVEDAGCFSLDQQPALDMGCVLSNCGAHMLAVNVCLGACPQYTACFR